MTSRQKVLDAVNHKEGLIPRDYSGAPGLDERVRALIGVAGHEAMLERFGVDIRPVGADFLADHPLWQAYQRAVPAGYVAHAFGPWRRVMPEGGSGGDQTEDLPRLKDATSVREIEALALPEPDWFDYQDLRNRCARYDEFARMLNVGSHMLSATGLRTMESFFMDLLADAPMAEALMERLHTMIHGFCQRALAEAPGQIEIIRMGSDLAMQQSLLVSPETFRTFWFGRIRQICDTAHRHGAKLMFHSCGAIAPLIPALIEAGIDILDPVQTSAAGMDLGELKRQFGRDITFHGGIDTQQFIPQASAAELRDEVRRVCDLMGKGGGYILCTSNSFMPDTEPQKVVAMYE